MWRGKSLVHGVSRLQETVTGMQRSQPPAVGQLEKYRFGDLISWEYRQRMSESWPFDFRGPD